MPKDKKNKKDKGNKLYTLMVHYPAPKGTKTFEDVSYLSMRDGVVKWKDPKTGLKCYTSGIPACADQKAEAEEEE